MGYYVLGMTHRVMENLVKAEEEFEKANYCFEEVGEKRELAQLSYERALLFKAKGEPNKAKEALERSFSMFEEMGMKLWAEKTQKALEELNQ